MTTIGTIAALVALAAVAGRAEPSWGYWDNGGLIPWDAHPYAAPFEAAVQAREATITQGTS